MQETAFYFASTPHIHFGVGKREELAGMIKGFGTNVLLITGGNSFDASDECMALYEQLSEAFNLFREKVSGEPSPEMIDHWVAKYRNPLPDVVVAIGGGSAVDAAKAVAGLLKSGDSVMEYLEGVGKGRVFAAETTPFIAMPTTAGTGGETSKNAVLSVIGSEGFKKSFRHESLVARHIILDPELTVSCSPAVTAACGMDAFTQLLESYVSSKASPMTDALAWSGLEQVVKSLLPAFEDGSNLEARAGMLYASSISGLSLANAGLGSVHGLASPLGAFFPIPHGVVCGTLLFEATKLNVEWMKANDPYHPALKKYAQVGRLLASDVSFDDEGALSMLLGTLELWQNYLQMPKLSEYGVTENDLEKIVANISGASMATNPVTLDSSALEEMLKRRL